jgi:hypothetical protein
MGSAGRLSRFLRVSLPGQDFYPLDRASFAWRPRCYSDPEPYYELLHSFRRQVHLRTYPSIALSAQNGSVNQHHIWCRTDLLS